MSTTTTTTEGVLSRWWRVVKCSNMATERDEKFLSHRTQTHFLKRNSYALIYGRICVWLSNPHHPYLSSSSSSNTHNFLHIQKSEKERFVRWYMMMMDMQREFVRDGQIHVALTLIRERDEDNLYLLSSRQRMINKWSPFKAILGP